MTKEEFCKEHISKLKKDTHIFKVLFRDTKTVDLMDEYEESNVPYLVLDGSFKKSITQDIALIITRDNPRMTDNNYPTMTELKKCINKYPNSPYLPDRMKYLASVISKTINEENYPDNTILPLKEPCSFGAQSSINRMDYGCEWLGGGDWEEKTLYGEITEYMIVGIMLTKSMWALEHKL